MELSEFKELCKDVLKSPTDSIKIKVGDDGEVCPVTNYNETSGYIFFWSSDGDVCLHYSNLTRVLPKEKTLDESIEALSIFSKTHGHGE